jgi:hypothetical protein
MTHNEIGLAGIYSARGVAVAENQVVVADSGRLLFWNDARHVQSGQPADGFVGAPNERVDFPPAFGRIREDREGRLWAIRGAQVLVYRLPLTTGAQPIATLSSPVPVAGGGAIAWDGLLAIGGVAPNRDGSAVWLADPRRNRVFRIRNPLTAPVADVVLGQASPAGTDCNQGAGSPSRVSLCQPGSVTLDRKGNVWVSDAALEAVGNLRLLEYDASLFRGIGTTARFSVPASRVFGTNGSFTVPGCQDALCAAFDVALARHGELVVGLNGIFHGRFPLVYRDPLERPHPDATLGDFHSIAYALDFDEHDDLYVADLNRDRVLVYRQPFARHGKP